MLKIYFRFTIFVYSVLALIVMVYNSNYEFVLAPIIIILSVIYSTFEDDNEVYKQRNEYYDSSNTYSYASRYQYRDKRSNHSRNNVSLKEDYKRIYGKCKRNFKVTIDNK